VLGRALAEEMSGGARAPELVPFGLERFQNR